MEVGHYNYGHAADFGGDFDGDRSADIVVSSPRCGDEAGVVYVYSGRTGERILAIDEPTPEGWFGCSVSVLDDVNGDERSDLAVGSTNWPPGPGKVYIHSGADGSILHVLESRAEQGMFGELCLVSKGGKQEKERLLVFCYLPGEREGERTPAFECFEIASWKSSWIAKLPSLESANGGGDHCAAIRAGDLSGTGSCDYLVGYNDDARRRRARALSAKDGSTLWDIGDVQWGLASCESSAFQDRNEDGRADVLIALRRTGANEDQPGELAILSGRDGSVLEQRAQGVLQNADSMLHFASAVFALGHIDADAVLDYAVFSSGLDRAWLDVHSGATGERLYAIEVREHLDWALYFRPQLLGGHDANGDSVPDLLLRCMNEESPGWPSQGVHLYSGRDGSELHHWTRESEFGAAEGR